VARIGLYPGTFDPVTLGHVDIIHRAAALVDHLIIGVATNKDKNPLFSLEQRVSMVQEALREDASLMNKVQVLPFETLLVQFATQVNANVIIRGIRNVTDFDYEYQMFSVNRHMNPSIETMFLFAGVHTQLISSRLVKEVARLEGDVSPFVPLFVAEHLKNRLKCS
jgi:pantetheine-phosphate adenylyltransferase